MKKVGIRTYKFCNAVMESPSFSDGNILLVSMTPDHSVNEMVIPRD